MKTRWSAGSGELRLARQVLGEQGQHGRHQIEQRDPFLGRPAPQVAGLEQLLGIGHHQGGAERQRHQHVAVERVVRQRRDQAVAIVAIKPKLRCRKGRKAVSEAWRPSTALGMPVEPEVKAT